MPEINFTIDAQTGEMEMKVEGVQGPQCADVAKIVTELTGAPQQEENTKEYYARPNVRPQIQNKKSVMLMKETTWIIDIHSGYLTVEGLRQSELRELAADILPSGASVNCARPINIEPLRNSSTRNSNGGPSLRVFRIYHNSVVEGPGRRSVLQTSGCPIRCPNCFVPETHDVHGGVEMKVSEVIERLLDPQGAPRDGVTILGGEPFLQPNGLLALMQSLKRRDQHITLYTGYTLEDLLRRDDRSIKRILDLTDILIDGPFVKELSDDANEWRGSTNQRIIYQPALWSKNQIRDVLPNAFQPDAI